MPTKEQLTQTIWIKKPFTAEQKIELGRQMADADERLAGKEAELTAEKDAYNETRKRLEGEADAIQLELRNHARMFRQGYEEVKIECVAKYDGSHVMFYDKDGLLVEERELTEAEQLRITGKMVDAEDVIRNARKED